MTCTKCGGLVIKGDEPGELKCVGCSKRFYAEDPMPTQTSDRRADEPQRDGGRCQGRQGRGQCKRPAANDGFCSAHSGQAPNPDRKPAKVGRPNSVARPGKTNGAPAAKEVAPEPNATPGATWHEWRASVLAQMDQAIGQLEEQLAKTKAARAAVEAL